jgi:hypothetical protein
MHAVVRIEYFLGQVLFNLNTVEAYQRDGNAELAQIES